MKEIDLIIRNSKYYVIWTTSIIQVDLTKEKMLRFTNLKNIFFFTVFGK